MAPWVANLAFGVTNERAGSAVTVVGVAVVGRARRVAATRPTWIDVAVAVVYGRYAGNIG